jgi:hypothetical protein
VLKNGGKFKCKGMILKDHICAFMTKSMTCNSGNRFLYSAQNIQPPLQVTVCPL